MSKERLEEIKRIRKNMQEFVDSDGCVVDYPRYDEQALLISDEGHLDWLIEQAERVQELEELEQEYIELNNDFTKLALENKRYREALEEIMKIQENHEWNLYGIAYGIAERTLFEVEGESE